MNLLLKSFLVGVGVIVSFAAVLGGLYALLIYSPNVLLTLVALSVIGMAWHMAYIVMKDKHK